MLALLSLLGVAGVLAGCGGGGGPGEHPLWSRYEVSSGALVARDCGFSAPLSGSPGSSIWLFCDTSITSKAGAQLGLPILGTDTAAVGPDQPGSAPGTLTEVATPSHPPVPAPPAVPGPAVSVPPVPDPATAPRPFLPAPAGLTRPASSAPCAGAGAYSARWISGVAVEPSRPRLLISFDDYCVTGTGGFTPEAFGLVEYDPASNALGAPASVFSAGTLPSAWVLGSPVFRGGYLYLFSTCARNDRCGPHGVFVARTPAVPAGWQDGYTYQYWTGTGWSSNPAGGAPLTSGTPPAQAWAGDFSAAGHGLVIIEQTSLAGDFAVWQASQPTGPWHRALTGRVPCATTKASTPGELCRALVGHPELSTPSTLLISWFDPGTAHLETTAYQW